MDAITVYRELFLSYLRSKILIKEPKGLYDPIAYILQLRAKRMRPILVLMATDLFGEEPKKALDAALAIEIFHNFTLIHDDIMDAAPLRRNQPTVHEKWDINTGILSGDAMLIQAYQCFESYSPLVNKQLITLFSKTALEICEGQQYDVEFETRDDVTIDEYLKMIEFKTAVLVAAALQMGAIIGGASAEDQEHLYNYGRLLGIAFQLQDDYLDAFGNPETFGKQVGGDIIENKKTYLYLEALLNGSETDKTTINELFSATAISDTKVDTVKEIFVRSKADLSIKAEIKRYTDKAFYELDQINVSPKRKKGLKQFGESLMHREE
ncbi:polyprenyl synthetase family protein [Gangjinia marincola]|uniref:Polyprenyl synthetase family protein n=1 Tax=Gangjinia marincola TaxID=578463 RepID=A0ABN1MEM5_9FLAO